MGYSVVVHGVGEIERQTAAEKFIVHVQYCNSCLPVYRLQYVTTILAFRSYRPKPTMSGEPMAIQAFELPYSESAVQDLRERIAHTRWPDTIPGSGWEYGFDLAYLQRIFRYWSADFDLKAETIRLTSLHPMRHTPATHSIHFLPTT